MTVRGWTLTTPGALLLAAAALAEPAGIAVEPGTRKMAARLAAVAESLAADDNIVLNAERAELLRRRLEEVVDPRQALGIRMRLGYELLHAGASDEAVAHFLEAREEAGRLLAEAERRTVNKKLDELLGIAYLRVGEQENCLAAHNPDSCLWPIRGSGVHLRQRGSRQAVETYLALLGADPENLAYRWLLNLGYMTLGEYPQGVPERWLIPPGRFDSDYALERFPDVAPQLGVDAVGLAGGSVMEDFDGDGHLDLMASSWGLTDPLRVYRNLGDGSFSDHSATAGLDGEVGGLNLVQADYDNDGRVDVLVLRGGWYFNQGEHPNSLLRNRGSGASGWIRFEDVTEEAGVLSFHPTQTAAWADFDNDGWLDLFIGNETTGSRQHPCELYRNLGRGADGRVTFSEVAAAVGVDAVGFVKGVAWGDYNNDGLQDLYLSRFGQPNVLYRNDGPRRSSSAVEPDAGEPSSAGWTFTPVTAQARVAEPSLSFATWFWDYDNDGWLDLLVAPFAGFLADSLAEVAADYLGVQDAGAVPRLYRNQGDGTFQDLTFAARLDRVVPVMGANYGDLDNDGFPDLYFGTGEPSLTALVPNRMFRNDRGRTFQDVTTDGGFGHLQKGHGISFGDFDGDGDQDLYAVMGGAYSGDVYANALFENPGFGNHWITLRLEGTKSSRSAIGARVEVVVATGRGDRDIHAMVGSGGSFGASSLQQEIGLGQAQAIRAVKITWPGSREPQTYAGVEMDRIMEIREGRPEVRVVLETHPKSSRSR